jgi:hypothetical protein
MRGSNQMGLSDEQLADVKLILGIQLALWGENATILFYLCRRHLLASVIPAITELNLYRKG